MIESMKKDVTFIILAVVLTIVGFLTTFLFYGVEITKTKEFIGVIGIIAFVDLLCFGAYKLANSKDRANFRKFSESVLFVKNPLLYAALHKEDDTVLQEDKKERVETKTD